VPLSSTYGATIANVTAAEMTARCVATRRDAKRADMVKIAALSIAPERLSELHDAAYAANAAATAAAVETMRLHSTAVAARAEPVVHESMRVLAAKLANEPRHGVRGKIFSDFFQGGADGTMSAEGKHDAQC
jgi:hypothetical protein